MPGGALAVAEGDEIVPPISSLLNKEKFSTIVATQDWHPKTHVSFASNHKDKKPFDSITLYGRPQVLWPDHCVQGTDGAQLTSKLNWDLADLILRKGTDPATDSYSAFRNNFNQDGERPATGLSGFLKNRNVERVFVCGLARDYCVKWTAEDAAAEGFDTYFLWDLTRPVDPSSDDSIHRDLTERGVHIIDSAKIA
ncbi:MAG: nicotinamidase [Gemmatimonadota bacterium]|nr:nicotinamidase [Gemmatimonadota bacterium]